MQPASRKRDASNLGSGAAVGVDTKKSKTTITSFFGVPKAKVSSAPLSTSNNATTTSQPPAFTPTTNFNKEKWVASLTPEQKELLQLEIDTLDESWLAHLKEEVLSKEFLNLKRFLKKEIASGEKIFPPLEDVYSWSRHTPLPTVRVVILGQDPYHNHNQAHGLCFSVRPPMPAPPSLKNMYIALKNDYPSFVQPPKNGGHLLPWAQRGVLMLNTCLTVRAHKADSHSKQGWEKFTQKVIDLVAKKRTRGVVFLAWGKPAGARVAHIAKEKGSKHCVLQSVHPSPLSAHRGFLTCGHFKKTNEWLSERYGEEGMIDWNLVEGAPSLLTSSTSTSTIKTITTSQNGAKENTTTASTATKTQAVVTNIEAKTETNGGEVVPGNPSLPPSQQEAEDDADALQALAEAECELSD